MSNERPGSDTRSPKTGALRFAAGIGIAVTLAAGCGSHSAVAAKPSTARQATASPAASLPDASAACATFAKAFRQFTEDGDLRKYLQATSNLNAPNDIKGAIAKFNGDVTVYAVATKHRTTLATLQDDAKVIKQDCGG
jgi:CMP-N-acetylneuraminic acid synthetase